MSPIDAPHELLTLAGETFPNFEPLAQLTKRLLAHVQSLLARG
jgi:hypothetical protein